MRAQVPECSKHQESQCINCETDGDPQFDTTRRLSRKALASARAQQNPIKNAPQREVVLPWETFLPARERDSGKNDWSATRVSNKKLEFKELLDEGKKRLEKAGQEQQLRERGEVVSTMGGSALDDLLADLREPSFSRQQNEKLRHGIALRLRTKIARVYSCVMSKYATRTDPTQRSADDDLARAIAAFRVKLNRLLDHSYLGEIQNQVTKELAGAPSVPATLMRQRECCKGVSQHRSNKNGPSPSKGVHTSAPSARGSRAVRVHTAHHPHSKPHPPKGRPSTAVPAAAGSATSSASGRRSNENNAQNRRQGDTEGSVGNEKKEDAWSCDTIAEDEKRRHGENYDGNDLNVASIPGGGGSFADVEISACSPDTTPLASGAFAEGSPRSEESFDIYVGEALSQSDSSGDVSGISSLSGKDREQVPRCPADQRHREFPHRAGDCQLPGQTESEGQDENDQDTDGGDEQRVRRGSGEKRNSSGVRRRRRKKERNKDVTKDNEDEGSNATVSGTALDEAWPNRWLTVLLTELGIHQSHQRTMLAKHMPETFEKGGEPLQNWPKSPSLSRIDRPHFSAAFAELPAAGKGRTLLMVPEPVAPGYEYSDVFEEVVKLHPPVGQLVLEEITRGNIMTRGDALAHVESIERSAEPNRAKLLVDEFMAEKDVTDILASAETLDLDLAQCAASGTMLNNDDEVP